MERLRLPAKLDSLEAFRRFVSQSATRAGAKAGSLARIELVLEEILTNHARHAYRGCQGDSEVGCSCGAPGWFCLEIADWGPPFDPLQQAAPDLSLDLKDRSIGGLGIYLARKTVDQIVYRREAEKNVLSVCFAIHRGAAQKHARHLGDTP